MRSRAALVILGCVLIALSVAGILLVQAEQERQQQAFKTKVAMEAAKAEGERKRAEELGQLVEIERRKVDDANVRLAAEQQKRREEESSRRRTEENRLAAQRKESEQGLSQAKPDGRARAGKDTSRGQDKPSVGQTSRGGRARASKEAASAARHKPGAGRAVTIRFKYDPSSSREMPVARVHLGDRVKVKVKRVAGADQKLFIGLTSPSWRGRGMRGGAPLVATTIRDSDEFKVAPAYGVMRDLAGAIDTEAGAVLNIGAGSPGRAARGRGPFHGPRRGYYEVEISIVAENRWDIKPRSLL